MYEIFEIKFLNKKITQIDNKSKAIIITIFIFTEMNFNYNKIKWQYDICVHYTYYKWQSYMMLHVPVFW